MKQTIEIEVPEGKKAVWKDNQIIFEDIGPQLPKTWEEFCKNYPINSGEFVIGLSSQIASPRWGDRDINIDRNVLPNYKAGEAHLAYIQLHQLRDCYRQGWIPNLTDKSDKYCIRWHYNLDTKSIEFIILNFSHVSTFLSFPTKELADKFLTNFRDLIEQAGDLI